MPRRHKREPLTDCQIQKIRRKEKNYNSRKRYKLKQRKLFFNEYDRICKKYGCYIGSLSGAFVSKQKRGETIYTIKSHLETVEMSL